MDRALGAYIVLTYFMWNFSCTSGGQARSDPDLGLVGTGEWSVSIWLLLLLFPLIAF
jgi:hypothetical protein